MPVFAVLGDALGDALAAVENGLAPEELLAWSPPDGVASLNGLASELLAGAGVPSSNGFASLLSDFLGLLAMRESVCAGDVVHGTILRIEGKNTDAASPPQN